MKQLFILIAMAMLFVACQNATKGSQITGGYTDQREPTESEIAIFNSVLSGSEVVYTPLSVASQVVAGMNYKFWCRYENKSSGASGHCWIVIYRNLDGVASLSSVVNAD